MDMAQFYADFGVGDGDGIQGLDTQERLDELQKALETSYLRQDQAGGQAMVPESLEQTLISTTFKEKHLRVWKRMPKQKAYSTVEEYATVDSFGTDIPGAGFFIQGDLPVTSDLEATRRFSQVHFLGTVRGITHPMTQVNSIGGPEGLRMNQAEAKEVLAGTRYVLRQLEYALLWGRNATIPTQFDGMEAQILGASHANLLAGADNIIDMRGQHLTDETLNEAAQIIADNFGEPELAGFLSNQTLTDLSNFLANVKRVNLDSVTPQGVDLGIPTRAFRSNFGNIGYEPCRFLRNESRVAPATKSHESAPAAPTLDVTAPHTDGYVTGADADSKFASGDAGNYYYHITAFNQFGESAPLSVGPVTVASGEMVTFYLDCASGVWSAASNKTGVSGYRIYRGAKGVSDTSKRYFIDEVAVDDADADEATDLNLFLPGTARAFIDDMSPEESISTKVLTPLLKWPLAIIDTRIRFALLLYLTGPILYAPKKHVEIINIGRFSSAE